MSYHDRRLARRLQDDPEFREEFDRAQQEVAAIDSDVHMLGAGREKGIWWFRIAGWGLHWKDLRHHRLLWSEREKVYWQFRVGPWVLTPLARNERGFRRPR